MQRKPIGVHCVRSLMCKKDVSTTKYIRLRDGEYMYSPVLLERSPCFSPWQKLQSSDFTRSSFDGRRDRNKKLKICVENLEKPSKVS